MRKLVRIAVVFLLFAPALRAQVVASHPRLILDTDTLAALRARAAANTPQWQQLKGYCDAFIGGSVELPDGSAYPNRPDIGQGYQGSSYWSTVLAEGLCYQVMLGIDANAALPYGQKAREILLAMATPYAGGSGHGQDPCTDDGYGTRFYGVGMGLGYDWAYPLLSVADRSTIYTTANAWLAAFADPQGCAGFEYAVPVANYYAGFFHALTAIALGTYGDNPQAPTLWSNWQNIEFDTAPSDPPHVGVQPFFAAHMAGGGWPEGFGSYGPLATLNMSLPAREVRTATGTDLVHAGAAYTFPVDSADYLMHFTWPSRDYTDDRDTNHSTGDPGAPPPGTANAGLFMQGLASLRYWNAAHADVMQQYANAVDTVTSGYGADEPWEVFLFWNPDGATQPLDTLPRSYFAPGLNAVSARSDWSSDAIWLSFRAGPYVDNPGAGEEGFDQGSLALVRGGTPLLVNGTGWIVHEPGGNDAENRIYTDEYGNFDVFPTEYTGNRQIYAVFFVRHINGTTVLDRYGQASYTVEDYGSQTHVAAFEDGGGYVYALATHLQDMYRPDGNQQPQVANWSREIVYLRPHRVVVYDRTTAGNATAGSTADDQFLAFDFAGDPVAGTAASGELRFDVDYGPVYAGAITTVLPSNAAATTVGMYPADGSNPASDPIKVWQLRLRPPDSQADQRWLNVFDPASSAATAANATALDVTAGAVTGTLLTASEGNTAVLFNTGSADTPVTGTLGYRIPQAAASNLITEVPARSGFSVTATPATGMLQITVVPGGPLYSSANGVLSFDVAADGAVTPGDRIFADGFGN